MTEKAARSDRVDCRYNSKYGQAGEQLSGVDRGESSTLLADSRLDHLSRSLSLERRQEQGEMASLASLLEQSQRLQASLAASSSAALSSQPGVDLPTIQLGLDQIESQSRRIAGRSLKEAGQAGNA